MLTASRRNIYLSINRRNVWSSQIRSKILSPSTETLRIAMNRGKANLSNLKKAKSVVAAQKAPLEGPSENTSPYFSPRQTRNQRKHIKIKTEKEDSVDTLSKTEQKLKPVEVKKESENTKPLSNEIAATKDVLKRKSIDIKEKTADSLGSKQTVDLKVDPKQTKWVPKDWEKTLDNLRQMRSDRSAPVDTMGCHKCADPNADEKTQRFHNLLALMLSSQTKDQTTFDAMNRLKAKGCTPSKMIEIDTNELEKLLCPVSFYKTKAKNIQKAAQILIDEYDSDIPPTVELLVKLPGVGPKMAHICMKTAWNVVSGIGVDTHVHRISNRLKWVPKATKEPEQTRIELEKWLPFELWSEVNEMMVGFGQTICTPVNPKCADCLNTHCPSRSAKKK